MLSVMQRSPVAIVPFRSGAGAKMRLAHVLPAAERAALAQALFERVTNVLVSCGLRVVAVCSAPTAAPEGVEVRLQTARGLNASLRDALWNTGVPALVVPADVPSVRKVDVLRLLAETGDVVVVPSADGGTNALLLRRMIAPAFGPRSALAHLRAARDAGHRARCVEIEAFARDVDDEAALTALSTSVI